MASGGDHSEAEDMAPGERPVAARMTVDRQRGSTYTSDP